MKLIFTILLILLLPLSILSAEGRTGEAVYKAACTVCHMSGVANAPKAHDEDAWKARKKSKEELLASSKKDLNAMPPMGTCMDCTDAELLAAIDYMSKKQAK